MVLHYFWYSIFLELAILLTAQSLATTLRKLLNLFVATGHRATDICLLSVEQYSYLLQLLGRKVSFSVAWQIVIPNQSSSNASPQPLQITATLLYELLAQVCNTICNFTHASLGQLLCLLPGFQQAKIHPLSILCSPYAGSDCVTVLPWLLPLLITSLCHVQHLHCASTTSLWSFSWTPQIRAARSFIQSYLPHSALTG